MSCILWCVPGIILGLSSSFYIIINGTTTLPLSSFSGFIIYRADNLFSYPFSSISSIDSIQSDIDIISSWLSFHFLTINPNKSNSMIIICKPLAFSSLPQLVLNNTPLNSFPQLVLNNTPLNSFPQLVLNKKTLELLSSTSSQQYPLELLSSTSSQQYPLELLSSTSSQQYPLELLSSNSSEQYPLELLSSTSSQQYPLELLSSTSSQQKNP